MGENFLELDSRDQLAPAIHLIGKQNKKGGGVRQGGNEMLYHL